jgi:hypothetical protein
MPDLLPKNALAGLRIAISVSDSPDLQRLGLLDLHFRLALAEIARCVLISGGTLAYGGHLSPEGYTTLLLKELQKFGRRDRPLLICLAWQVHRALPLKDLEATKKELGLLGNIICLGPDGSEVDPSDGRGKKPEMVRDPELLRRSLTSLRHYMSQHTQARVLIGGKRHDFQGEIPGLMEEAIVSCEAHQPLYLAGGFGGVTLDIASALGVDDGTWLPTASNAPPPDPRFLAGRARLVALAQQSSWIGLNNGLTDDQNKRLTASHRPSDIAALISFGLGRRMSGGGTPA